MGALRFKIGNMCNDKYLPSWNRRGVNERLARCGRKSKRDLERRRSSCPREDVLSDGNRRVETLRETTNQVWRRGKEARYDADFIGRKIKDRLF